MKYGNKTFEQVLERQCKIGNKVVPFEWIVRKKNSGGYKYIFVSIYVRWIINGKYVFDDFSLSSLQYHSIVYLWWKTAARKTMYNFKEERRQNDGTTRI